MGWGRAWALAAWVMGAPAWAGGNLTQHVAAPVTLTPSARLGSAGFDGPMFVEAQRLPVDRQVTRGQGLLLGYKLRSERAELLFRAGYRHGLPLAEAPVFEDRSLLLTSGGSIAVSAGTVTWLQLDLDGFREIAGSRIVRLEAVPGLRFRFGRELPWEAGVGVLAALRPAADSAGFGFERFAGVLQMCGRF